MTHVTPRYRSAEHQALVEATVWSTDRLVAWATDWPQTDGIHYVWELISQTQLEAKAFYLDLMSEQDESYVRWCAAEALTDGGWTLAKINFRKS